MKREPSIGAASGIKGAMELMGQGPTLGILGASRRCQTSIDKLKLSLAPLIPEDWDPVEYLGETQERIRLVRSRREEKRAKTSTLTHD